MANTDKEAHKELIETITKFRDEEQEHHDIGLENDAELAPAYQLLSGGIKVRKVASNMYLNVHLETGMAPLENYEKTSSL